MSHRPRTLVVVLTVALTIVGIPFSSREPADAGFRTTVRLSSDSTAGVVGPGAGAGQTTPSVSPDGRFVAFAAAGDADGERADIFLRDLLASTTRTVSTGRNLSEPNGSSSGPSTTPDGRFVAFSSQASNLVEGDTNATADVFVRDMLLGSTHRVSVAADGGEPDGPSRAASISADGRYVAFESTAANLVPGDDNGESDVFVRDMVEGQTTLVSSPNGAVKGDKPSSAPVISADGRYVAFESLAGNLGGGDTGGVTNIYRKDIQTGQVDRVSPLPQVPPFQGSFSPSMSADGNLVAFESKAPLVPPDNNNVSDVFVKDMGDSTLRLVSSGTGTNPADGASGGASLAADGSVVAYRSVATDIMGGNPDGVMHVYLHHLGTGGTARISVSTQGVAGDGASFAPSTSVEGTTVAFFSDATNLVPARSTGRTEAYASLGCPYDQGPVSGAVPPSMVAGDTGHQLRCAAATRDL